MEFPDSKSMANDFSERLKSIDARFEQACTITSPQARRMQMEQVLIAARAAYEASIEPAQRAMRECATGVQTASREDYVEIADKYFGAIEPAARLFTAFTAQIGVAMNASVEKEPMRFMCSG